MRVLLLLGPALQSRREYSEDFDLFRREDLPHAELTTLTSLDQLECAHTDPYGKDCQLLKTLSALQLGTLQTQSLLSESPEQLFYLPALTVPA